jgi:hypothetical protein
VLFECHVSGQSLWDEEPVRLLHQLGYRLYAFDLGQVFQARIRAIDESDRRVAGHDFLAVLPGDERIRPLEGFVK